MTIIFDLISRIRVKAVFKYFSKCQNADLSIIFMNFLKLADSERTHNYKKNKKSKRHNKKEWEKNLKTDSADFHNIFLKFL